MFKPKEKGQGLVEYAVILLLVAIVVIAALMILGPMIGNVLSKVNNSLSHQVITTDANIDILSNAPLLDYEIIGVTSVPVIETASYTDIGVGCTTYNTYGKRIKIGTTYLHPEEISAVMLNEKEFQVCSNATGATVHIIIAFIEPLR